MNAKALVVIDIQNDITKHYRDIVSNINAAIDCICSGDNSACPVKMQAAGLPNDLPDVKALLLTYLYCFISFQLHYQILIRFFFGMNSLPFLMLKASYHSSI